jgi:uncharacterized membrane protein required for colicin V production
MENWLSIAAGVYLIGMILYGHYRGFIRLAVSVVALIASMTIVHAAMPVVTEYLKENTKIQESISNSMKKAVGLELAEITGIEESSQEIPSSQRSFIEGLDLPESIKSALIENNNSEAYQILGVERFTDYIGNYMANMIISSVGSVLLFALVYLAMRLIMRWLNLIAKLPIISGMNKIAGALLGAVQGLVFLWLFFLVLTAFSGTTWGIGFIRQIEASKWLSFLYNHNLISVIFLGVLNGML